MVIRISKLETLVLSVIIITVSFVFALNYEHKSTTVSADIIGVKLPVIMYHHITEDEKRAGKYTVLKSEFEKDLEYIKSNNYSTVTVNDLINYVNGNGEFPENPIMITFDDGFESFYAIAFPLLKKYNMKAVVSVIGSVTEKYSKIDDHNINYSNLTWQEISELNMSGLVEIQNHSYNMHKNDTNGRKGLSKLKNENYDDYRTELTEDLIKTQTLLDINCGITPTAVIYPYGAYSKETLEIIKECGFCSSFLCEERVNTIIKGDKNSLYNLGRYNRESGIETEIFFDKLK